MTCDLCDKVAISCLAPDLAEHGSQWQPGKPSIVEASRITNIVVPVVPSTAVVAYTSNRDHNGLVII